MTSPMNPTWYDVLGVPHDASPAEIKAAWRNATDKFEPGSGSGQFRMFNEAADVLLDPARRAAYDESLAPADDGVSDDAEPATEPPPPAPIAPELEQDVPEADAPEADAPEALDKPRRRWPRSRPAASAAATAPVEHASLKAGILVLVLGLLTVAAVVAAGILGMQVRENARIAAARDEAPGAAERAAKSVFQYDYRTLPADRKRAEGFLTGGYKKEYTKAATSLEKQKDGSPGLALQTKAVVTATAVASGVVDADEDSVRVLVYVNQVSQKAGGEPQIFQNRVAMTMEKEGKRWLLSKVDSY